MLVERAVDELLGRFTAVAESDATSFLGAQFDAGLAWVHFRPGDGGLGVAKALEAYVSQRLSDVGAPESTADFVARHQVAAVISRRGTPAQRQRHLRRIFTGEDHWCQLFSEPGAGSDLANVSASAIRDGDLWRINGQKVWCSGAREATFGLLLARTDSDAPKHSGLTTFIMNMRDAAVEVRPLRQADGGARFNEVFFADLTVSDEQRFGEIGGGWGMALEILGTERAGALDGFMRPVSELLDLWASRIGAAPSSLRDDVTKTWMAAKLIELNELRRSSTSDEATRARLAAIGKVTASEYAQRLANSLAAVAGPSSLIDICYDAAYREDLLHSSWSPTKFWTMPLPSFVVRSRAMSIEGGTNEINRNIIGERVLHLPPEPRLDKGVPWRQTIGLSATGAAPKRTSS